MSVEIKLTSVAFGVVPIEGGKQVNLVDQQSGFAYIVPFTDDAVKTLIEKLGMTNEDLLKELEAEERKKQIEIASELPPDLGNNKKPL